MMLYAKTDREFWPPGFEEAEWLHRKLQKMAYAYQMEMRTRMFSSYSLEAPAYQFAIIKWENHASRARPGRTVVWEGTDYAELTGMLRMLIAVEEGNLVSGNDEVVRII